MGEDLALVEGTTAQILGRKASKKLWTDEELKCHMLSPKVKSRKNVEARIDFTPTRKETFKGNMLVLMCLLHSCYSMFFVFVSR